MKNVVQQHILTIKPYLPGKPIEEVKREMGLKEIYKLASNENPFGPSLKTIQAMRKALKGLNRYPEGSCFDLRRVLARRLGVTEQQLIFGNGSDEIICMAARAFLAKGDEVVVARPTFLIYEIASRVCGATIRWAPLKNFRYDLIAMKKLVNKKTKIVFVANPDNPTGSYVTRTEIDDFLEGLSKDILVFLDEAYFEYIDQKDYPDSLALIQKHKNIIFTRTFSKSYALAGSRIGYGVADLELIEILNRVREPFNVNAIAQAGALAALRDQAYYQRIQKIIKEQKQRLYREFEKMGILFVRSETNFVLVDVQKDSQKIFQELLKKGVVVRDMGTWGFKTCIRVTVGKPHENTRFIKSLKEIL